MSGYSSAEIWAIIVALALGTYLIRLSFLGFVRPEALPPIVLRLLRYTPVAVLPAMVAPLVVWSKPVGGQLDPLQIVTGLVTLAVGWASKNTLWAAGAGGAVLVLGTLAGL